VNSLVKKSYNQIWTQLSSGVGATAPEEERRGCVVLTPSWNKQLASCNQILIRFCFLLGILSVLSCAPSAKTPVKAPKIDSVQAFALLKECAAIGPRHSGSAGAIANVELISRYLRKFSVSFELDKWKENTPEGLIEFCNVIADIPGKNKDKFILIGCHYDTKLLTSVHDFEGANDGASGVGLLLAMIDAIKKTHQSPPVNLKFVFFDGEECIIEYSDNDGLYGSRHLATKMNNNEELKKCLAIVILDMIGDKDLNITIPSGTDKHLAEKLLKIATEQNSADKFHWHNTDIIDDHTPFQKLGIPAIDIIDFEFGPGNRYWHTQADTVDKTSKKSLQIVGDATLRLIWEIPQCFKE
jgi:Zn-dependent M28 family amino/carboxypeptidase